MSASRSFKLGLFALAALGAAIAVAVALGVRAMAPNTVAYHTYFDESVQGLELGSPVKYRGVRIGNVDAIDVAPDRKHVDVTLALREREVERLGLGESKPGLRTQLAVQGLTGLRFVEIDFFDSGRTPPPLPFVPEEHYIPAAPSLIKGLESDLESLAQRTPALLDRIAKSLDHFDQLVDDVRDEHLAARLGDALDRTGAAASELRKLTRHIDDAQLPQRTSDVLASAHRASESIGDLGRSTLGSSDELSRALRELADASRAIRELAEEVERDPDMLVKGRARSGKR